MKKKMPITTTTPKTPSKSSYKTGYSKKGKK